MANSIQERIEQFVQTALNMSSLGAAFLYNVGKLLTSLGYTMQDGDDWLLGFSVQTVEARIKNDCNIPYIPPDLFELAARMSVGEFFNSKRGMGQLQGFDLDFEAAIKQIKEGDTTVQFDGEASDEQKLNSLISWLLTADERQLSRFRRLVW